MLLLPAIASGPNTSDPMRGQLILSTFTGAGLLDRAFAALGACVVSAGDLLAGHDIRDFHALPGRFDGVIGGPPCQSFSEANRVGGQRGDSVNLIPEFLRIVNEVRPAWAVMENVTAALPFAPDWPYAFIEDYNCGGHTSRERGFWFYGMPACPLPAFRSGEREWTVIATSWTNRPAADSLPGVKRFSGHSGLKAHEAAYLQGYPDLGYELTRWLPAPGNDAGLSPRAKSLLAVHMMGNGVPASMANHVAGHVAYYLRHGKCASVVQMPMFMETAA